MHFIMHLTRVSQSESMPDNEIYFLSTFEFKIDCYHKKNEDESSLTPLEAQQQGTVRHFTKIVWLLASSFVLFEQGCVPAWPWLVKQTRSDKSILLTVIVTAALLPRPVVLFFKSFSLCKGAILGEGRI